MPTGWLRVVVCGDVIDEAAPLAGTLRAALGHGHRVSIVGASPAEEVVQRLATTAVACDAAVVVVDPASDPHRVRLQIHALSELGVHPVVVAVDVTGLGGRSAPAFDRVQRSVAELATQLGSTPIACVPVAARDSDADRPPSWYRGPTLRDGLARAAEAITVPVSGTSGPESADRFEATVIWTADRPMLQSRAYRLSAGEQTVRATVAPLKYRVDSESLQHAPAKTLRSGEVGVCNLELARPIPIASNHGRFTLLDDDGQRTLGVGRLHFALHRSQNLRWQTLDIDQEARADLLGQRPCILWFTGLSGAGKSTIANLVEKRLHALGRLTYLLDGDNVRHGLNRDLGFTDVDRVENIRRVAEVARLMVDAGLIVLVSFISPFRSERRMARALVGQGEFVEVFVDTPLGVAESRDPKGLYRKARQGDLKNFTGVDSPYEPPEHAEIHLDTTRLSPEESAAAIIDYLADRAARE